MGFCIVIHIDDLPLYVYEKIYFVENNREIGHLILLDKELYWLEDKPCMVFCSPGGVKVVVVLEEWNKNGNYIFAREADAREHVDTVIGSVR